MRISGKSFTIHLNDLLVFVNTMTADIEDNRAAVKDRGIPNGYVDGEVACTGELEVDAANLKLIMDAANRAGSFRDLKLFDINTYADTGTEAMKVELFGCLLKISGLLDIDSAGGEKHATTLPFEVTSPDFVKINDTPYLSRNDTDELRVA